MDRSGGCNYDKQQHSRFDSIPPVSLYHKHTVHCRQHALFSSIIVIITIQSNHSHGRRDLSDAWCELDSQMLGNRGSRLHIGRSGANLVPRLLRGEKGGGMAG